MLAPDQPTSIDPPGYTARQRHCQYPGQAAGCGARLRDIRTGPDGAVWVLTDASPGKVLRLVH